jgi:Protein of unknown function (DUF3551)
MMRSLLVLGILAGAAIASRAQAQNYPWCAEYSGSMGGSMNCGFTTHEQCMATVSGMGGFCVVNTQYQLPVPGPLHWRSGKRHACKNC